MDTQERTDGAAAVRIDVHTGPRHELRPLFELAEDSPDQLEAHLDRGRVLVAVLDGAVVGHLQLVGTADPARAELLTMAVRESHQGRGIGARLVAAAVRFLEGGPATTLEVATAAADIGNLRFYQRQGFRFRSVERDAFTPATGYAEGLLVDGIALRDRVRLDRRVGAGRTPLFGGTELAARIEHAEARLMAEATRATTREHPDDGFVVPVAGGVATFAGPDSPYNKIAGLGFGGVPDPDALDAIEAAFARRGAATQAEVSSMADPAVVEALVGRGYRLAGHENVLGRDLRSAALHVADPDAGVPGVEVRRSRPDELDAWLALVVDAALHPDDQGVPMEEFPRDVLERAERASAAIPGVRRYVALRAGTPAGGAGLRPLDGIAQMTGAATAPRHRHHGVQTALLAARLADAADAGCDVAVVTTQPGSRSQHNVQRRGFDLLYTRAVLVKEPGA